MKKILFAIAAVALLLVSCGKSQPEFTIKGTTGQDRLNGVRVFLVPCNPQQMMFTDKHFEDSIGVDSVVIENGQFEFKGKGEYLARVTIDWHKRYGTQDLLIVTEPGGVINVVIDSVSHGGGTPQNEALEKWKTRKINHDAQTWQMSQYRQYLLQTGDSAHALAFADTIKNFNEEFRQEMVDLAKIVGSGPAYDLLIYRYNQE